MLVIYNLRYLIHKYISSPGLTRLFVEQPHYCRLLLVHALSQGCRNRKDTVLCKCQHIRK
jgi:hypothetical protein